MNLVDMALEILQTTRDGDNLKRSDLAMVQHAVNGFLTPAGETLFKKLHEDVVSGNYEPSGFCGFSNITMDHEGYIYYKGTHVEHYSHSLTDEENPNTIQTVKELNEMCERFEREGIRICASYAGFFNSTFKKAFNILDENDLSQVKESFSKRDIEILNEAHSSLFKDIIQSFNS